jgi:hypothetical protein
VKQYVTKRTVRAVPVESISKKIKLNVKKATPKDQQIFAQLRDEVEEKLQDLRNFDKSHNLDYTTGVEIKKWEVIACATHQVAYGEQLFGKVDIGSGQYIHVRYFKLT